MNNRSIGIFDSGVGGLTVVKEILKGLAHENIIYLGDTARVPYGTRDNDTVHDFSADLVRFLLRKKVKALVVACNTMSAISLEKIKEIAGDIPVIDVITPTVKVAINSTRSNSISVIGTRATINSNAYKDQIKNENKSLNVIQVNCPLFVPLVEEGFINNKATELIAQEYLEEINKSNADVLILGCTHYPMLSQIIKSCLKKKDVRIIDSALPTAKKLEKILKENNLLNNSENKPTYKFYVTDNPDRSLQIANLFFDGKFPGKINRINLDK